MYPLRQDLARAIVLAEILEHLFPKQPGFCMVSTSVLSLELPAVPRLTCCIQPWRRLQKSLSGHEALDKLYLSYLRSGLTEGGHCPLRLDAKCPVWNCAGAESPTRCVSWRIGVRCTRRVAYLDHGVQIGHGFELNGSEVRISFL